MTVMTPRTKARKPAVVYFPGGGFTSADHEKFIEMRHALARAGFVVAAAEYRVRRRSVFAGVLFIICGLSECE